MRSALSIIMPCGLLLRPCCGYSLQTSPSEESSDPFGHDQMRLSLTTIVGINTCFEFVRAQQPIRFRHGPLAMDPFRLNGVEPRTFAGQVAAHETHPDCAALDPLIMLAYPVPHGLATVPRGVIPDQQQRGEALGCELGRAPGQKIDRDRTHRAPGHTPEPHLLGLLARAAPPPTGARATPGGPTASPCCGPGRSSRP